MLRSQELAWIQFEAGMLGLVWHVVILLSISRSPTEPARMTLVVGKTGAGKSSLIEDITGATGLSGNGLEPGTK